MLIFGNFGQRPCYVGCTNSQLDTEAKQLWAWAVLGWKNAWELLELLAVISKLVQISELLKG